MTNHVHGLGLISFMQILIFFYTYFDSVKHFKDIYFLVIHLKKKAHVKICKIEHMPSYVSANLFCKFWSQSHLLTWNESYVYKEDDIYQEDVFLKRKMVDFYKEVSYVGYTVPPNVASDK